MDRLGQYMRQHGTTEEQWRSLSGDVNDAVISAVRAGCKGLHEVEAPCQVLLAGGDDAVVALPADHLFRFLNGFRREFESRRFLDGQAPSPTYSVGAILANSHYPIFEFRRLAEELMRSAKQIEREESSIDFAILTASMTDGIINERDRLARRTLGPRRTAKPYTISEFFGLEERVRELKAAGVPSSKIKALYRMVYEGRLQADLDYLYLLSRLESEHRDVLRRAVGPQLWKPGPNGGEITVAADLVEIWDFVHDA